jgi:hypothetical protein
MTKKFGSEFPDLKWTLGLVSLAILCLTTGFVPPRFAHWVVGEVVDMNPRQMTLLIRDDPSQKFSFLRWNEQTRFWIHPSAPRDPGVLFDPKNLAVGTRVRVMFKKYSDYNRATRIIRLAPPQDTQRKTN